MFTIESINDDQISIIHSEYNHWYQFYIVNRQLRPAAQRDGGGDRSVNEYAHEALHFAEAEARKHGKID